MSKASLVSHIKKQAMGWTLAGIILTATLSGSLFFVLVFKYAEREITTAAQTSVSSSRKDLFSGDVRGLELRLRKQFEIKDDEKLLFLDPSKKPWVGDGSTINVSFCDSARGLCQNIFSNEIKFDYPIYFDSEKSSLWGYFHIEKHPHTNWPLVASVILTIVLGMLFQAFGFYFNIIKSIQAVGETLASWAQRLSANPKDISQYESAPFSEIEPIENALTGLRAEIDLLEKLAREEGALTTLRGIGHDILNPVARIKRIVGLIEMRGTLSEDDQALIHKLSSNLKRLSSYAEQLKLLYKYKTGEITDNTTPILDLSTELKNLTKDLAFDPDVLDKKIEFLPEIINNCLVRIPAPILGRIVENIVGNSIHASHEMGVIKIKTIEDKKEIHLTVEDEGSGIDDDIKNKIFLPDFTTKSNKGTGLGLFVVKQLCEHYGGLISLHSEVGRGTTIKLSFPRAEAGV